MHSLFIGRWQPFHNGHKKLIDKVLIEEGRPVVIAIRNTPVSEKNPYTVEERKQMIKKVYRRYGRKVKIIAIPDIKEVVYGRKVGWGVRRIRLDKQTEEISGTKTRNFQKGIVWLTGNVGAGKTSLAYLLKERLDNAVVLDGDEMRASISTDKGFSMEDREEHNLRVARLAKMLNNQGHNVIVSVIAPFEKSRKKIDKICRPYWIYVQGGVENNSDMPYEPPTNPHLVIEKSKKSLLDNLDKILKEVGSLPPAEPAI